MDLIPPSYPVQSDKRFPAQVGVWTLTAPDGTKWQSDSPLRVVAAEARSRIPPDVALQRIQDGLAEETELATLRAEVTRLGELFNRASADLVAAKTRLGAEVTRLQAENERIQSLHTTVLAEADERLMATMTAGNNLANELASVRQDARRYQWIRGQEYIDVACCWLLPNTVDSRGDAPATPEEIDIAIDAALEQAKEAHG